MPKTIGLIARADNSGLGTCSWELARHMKFDQIKIVSNGRYKSFPERFYNIVGDLSTDIVVTIETTFGYQKKQGQKLALIPMYECTPPAIIKLSDLVISPSLLDKQYFPNSVFIPFPINRQVLPYRKRSKSAVFVHNAGHGGLGGRNGTRELVEAFRWVKSDIRLIINSQVPVKALDPRIEVRVKEYENYYDIWHEGDIFIFPEKFNGLSLPINEAISVGMPVICNDRYPFNVYLPRELLIPIRKYSRQQIAREFDMAEVDPKDIATTIDKWANKDISKYSSAMNQLAEMFSWDKLGKKYEQAIKSCF